MDKEFEKRVRKFNEKLEKEFEKEFGISGKYEDAQHYHVRLSRYGGWRLGSIISADLIYGEDALQMFIHDEKVGERLKKYKKEWEDEFGTPVAITESYRTPKR